MDGSNPKKPGKSTPPLPLPPDVPPVPSSPLPPPSPEDTLEKTLPPTTSTSGVHEPSLPLPPPPHRSPSNSANPNEDRGDWGSAPIQDAEDLLKAPLPTSAANDYYPAILDGRQEQRDPTRCPPALRAVIDDFREIYRTEPERIQKARAYNLEKANGPDHELQNVAALRASSQTPTARTALSGMKVRGGDATVAEQIAWGRRDEEFLNQLAAPSADDPAESPPRRTLNYAPMGSKPDYQQVIAYVKAQLQAAAASVNQSERPLRVWVVPLGFMDNRTVLPTLGLMSRSEVTLTTGSNQHYVFPLCGETTALLTGDRRLEPFCLDLIPGATLSESPSSLIRPLPGATLSEESLSHIKKMFPSLDLYHDSLRSQLT